MPDSTSDASLANDQVLSQDAYGSTHQVTIGGASVPVADLAVGRLVETPEEIEATIDHYLGLTNGTLPKPDNSLVTGYDFLADAAHRVNDQFDAALPGDTSDTLIAENGTPHAQSWTAADLRTALLGEHHDLVYLAGHFSANDTLAANFNPADTFEADEIDPAMAPNALKDTLVLSAGCHSGYNIVDNAQIEGVTNPNDWAQRMAQQQAVLIGGTGYQYGDTDFLEYSERLYLDVARRLREGDPNAATNAPVAVGNAPDPGEAGLPREPGLPGRHRPEGRPAGHALRSADDRLRRAGPGQARRRRLGGRPQGDHDGCRWCARPQRR